jgi:DNA-binding protein HU-beta
MDIPRASEFNQLRELVIFRSSRLFSALRYPCTNAAPKARAKASASPAKAARSKPKVSSPPPKQEVITLKQLALQIGEDHDLLPKQAQALLSSVVDLLVEHLKAGDKLRLKGLGVLEVKNRPARTGRNPATGATVQIAASKKIAFRPAKELKEAI